jgi:hypothetical protein
MGQTDFSDQVATLNATLQSLEAKVTAGNVPRELLTDFKSSVDDMRLRLWGLLSAGSANDYRAFQERFQLRRAKEICRGVENELRSGQMSSRHEELRPLREAAKALALCIDESGPNGSAAGS